MRLYPKKLRNLEDLERERKLLLKESRQLDKEEFLSIDGLTGRKRSEGGNGKTIESSLLDLLPFSNPLVSQLVKILVRRFLKRDGAPKQSTAVPTEEKKEKNWIKTIAFEFIGGYLKWKAIELSYKGIKHLLKKRRENN